MNRLKLILICFLALAPSTVNAENISLNKATEAAEKFFAKCGAATRSGSHLELLNRNEVTMTRGGESAPFYIFNRKEGGFVIISGIDAARPVLGYSLDRSFSMAGDMPENLRDWLDMYRQQINGRRLTGVPATDDEKARWTEALTVTKAAAPKSVYLKTPEFAQGSPFNKLLPKDSDGRTVVAGCVTIAAAQLMAYYKHPIKGTGTLPGYTTSKGFVMPDVQLGHEYKWDKILDKYTSGQYTDEQADAVARLVYDLAVMGQVEMSSSSTTGNTNATFPAMSTYMGYDKSVRRFGHWNMDDETWKSVLLETLDKGQPIPFSASSTSGGGHAFIVDGYDDMENFHINWGWNGSSNGYYKVSAFGSYIKEQLAYVDLIPDRGGEYEYNMSIKSTSTGGSSYDGIMVQSANLAKGGSVVIKFGGAYNYGFVPLKGEVTFAHKDKNGTIKEFLIEKPLEMPELAMKSTHVFTSNITLSIKKDIERGDYIEPLFRVLGRTQWNSFYNASNKEDALLGILPMHVRDYTKLTFKKNTKTLTVKTFKGTSYSLAKTGGATLLSGKLTSETVNISLMSYGPGSYTFTLENGDTSASFKIIL